MAFFDFKQTIYTQIKSVRPKDESAPQNKKDEYN